jgi:predicted YcjX-like family ATPase
MDPKVTRHVSTNLEELNEKIARLLKDPAEAIEFASINIDAMTLPQLKAFAEEGTLEKKSKISVVMLIKSSM